MSKALLPALLFIMNRKCIMIRGERKNIKWFLLIWFRTGLRACCNNNSSTLLPFLLFLCCTSCVLATGCSRQINYNLEDRGNTYFINVSTIRVNASWFRYTQKGEGSYHCGRRACVCTTVRLCMCVYVCTYATITTQHNTRGNWGKKVEYVESKSSERGKCDVLLSDWVGRTTTTML